MITLLKLTNLPAAKDCMKQLGSMLRDGVRMVVRTTKTLLLLISKSRISVQTPQRKTGICQLLRFSVVMPVDIMFQGSGRQACLCVRSVHMAWRRRDPRSFLNPLYKQSQARLIERSRGERKTLFFPPFSLTFFPSLQICKCSAGEFY
jgi:hypothetical protein